MSNFLHKVKDAVTSHLHPENKGSRRDSSKMENPVNDASDANRPSTMGDKMEGPGNTYGTTTTGVSDYDSAVRDSNMGDAMKTSDNYGSTTAGLGRSGGNLDSSKMASGMNDTAGAGMDNLDSGAYTASKMGQNVEPGGYGTAQQHPSTMDSGPLGMQNRAGDLSTDPGTYSSTGGYGSGNMNTGSGLKDSKMANDMNTAADTSLGNRGTYGDTMANQMENRANQGVENLSGQQGFGGAAAGGSSYNAPTPTRRRSSGPHSSNWLNKLDPRVHSSDYEANAASNQRGN